MKQAATFILLIMLLAACREAEVHPPEPALLINPGPGPLEEIQQTVSAALNGVNVTLSEDVFTTSSVLVVERGMQRGVDRPPELGRDLGRPHRFQLVTDGQKCILIDPRDSQHYPLASVECTRE